MQFLHLLPYVAADRLPWEDKCRHFHVTNWIRCVFWDGVTFIQEGQSRLFHAISELRGQKAAYVQLE